MLARGIIVKTIEIMNLELSVARCESTCYNEYGFNNYHYMDSPISKSSKCFLFYLDDEVAGFCSVINNPFKGCSNGMRFHRIVVLPKFEKKGIGVTMCRFVASILQNSGAVVYMKCQSETLGRYFGSNLEEWMPTANNKKMKKNNDCEGSKFKNRIEAVCFCYKFIGEGITGYEDLLLPIVEMRKENKLLKINKLPKNMKLKLTSNKVTILKEETESVAPTSYRSMGDAMAETRNNPQKRQLFKEFWYEGQIGILFSEEGLGKSVLAMQIAIANSITDKVLYIDRENSDDTIYERYTSENGEYQFSSNIIYPSFKDTNFVSVQQITDFIIKQHYKYKVKIVIIDNISAITDRLESAAVMSNVMKSLIQLREKYGLSILIIAHSKKRNKKNPIENNDMAGSKKIAVLAESVFAIGHAIGDKKRLYLKQIKQRYKGEKYDSDNVLQCHIEKIDNYLQMIEDECAKEEDLLDKGKTQNKDEVIDMILAMREGGLSNRAIAKEINISEATVRNYLKAVTVN